MKIRGLSLSEVGPFATLDMRFPEGDPKDGRAEVHLLVGPNGSGKSTVLSAIAQCFAYGEAGLAGRLWAPQSFAAAETTLGWRGVRPLEGSTAPIVVPRSAPLIQARFDANRRYRYFYGDDGFFPLDNAYWKIQQGSSETAYLPFAVFAYGGLRQANQTSVQGIVEQKDNPLTEAASFTKPSGTGPFVQWLINTFARRSLYLTSGQASQAEQRDAALNRLARAMEDVVGAPVQFHLELDPFALKIQVGMAAATPIDQLPEGLQSLLSWVGDLLMRLDRIPWSEPVPVTDRSFVLLLDEVEVHLHPGWQRRVLPMAERLFPNAQIIASTHSPFVIGSATDAWIHPFRLEGDHAAVGEPLPTARGTSYPAIVDSILGISEEFDIDSEALLREYRQLWHARLRGDASVEGRLQELVRELSARSQELTTIIGTEQRELLHRLARRAASA